MRLPHPPSSATRFWARVTSGYCECPRCGTVLYFRSPPATHGQASTTKRTTRLAVHCTWDPWTSRLKCHTCQLTVQLGLMAWPVKAHGRRTATAPRDQVPEERQLARMRAMEGQGAGWWMPNEQAKGRWRPDDTNVTAGCTCRPGSENTTGQDPNCPIHGT